VSAKVVTAMQQYNHLRWDEFSQVIVHVWAEDTRGPPLSVDTMCVIKTIFDVTTIVSGNTFATTKLFSQHLLGRVSEAVYGHVSDAFALYVADKFHPFSHQWINGQYVKIN
jgi:hypothetical protein